MARAGAAPEDQDESALEESARAKLGVQQWDRPVIFRETAEAATDIRLPYWSLLFLSGAIATFGLALNNAAVVIGAMLIAPLMSPTLGLALALAVGDVRLASQTAVAVVVSTLLVVGVGTVLTLALPFQTLTSEISARTRPTTLDLGIAVFSGLAGAVVAVTRRKGLSAAIPGVAVAVALIPPLAVAGFCVGAGFRWSFIRGAMLLYGANLAGIVFSGTLVFLLIGMHRPAVVAAAREWHENTVPTRLAAWAAEKRWYPHIGPVKSPLVRVGLVLVFVTALGIPLTITLGEIARETRVKYAVNRASQVFEVPGRSSVIGLQTSIGETESQAVLRVATTDWFGDEARETFEREAAEVAGERVELVLEQIPTSSGNLEQMAGLIPGAGGEPPPRATRDLVRLLAPARERIREATGGITLPDSTRIVGSEMVVAGRDHLALSIGYTAPRPLSDDTRQILTRQLRMALSQEDVNIRWQHVPLDTLVLTATESDSAAIRRVATRANRYDGVRLLVIADSTRNAAMDSTVGRLLGQGVDRDQIKTRRQTGDLRLVVGSAAISPQRHR